MVVVVFAAVELVEYSAAFWQTAGFLPITTNNRYSVRVYWQNKTHIPVGCFVAVGNSAESAAVDAVAVVGARSAAVGYN